MCMLGPPGQAKKIKKKIWPQKMKQLIMYSMSPQFFYTCRSCIYIHTFKCTVQGFIIAGGAQAGPRPSIIIK